MLKKKPRVKASAANVRPNIPGRQAGVPVFSATGRVFGWWALRANQREASRQLTDQLNALDRTHFSERQIAFEEAGDCVLPRGGAFARWSGRNVRLRPEAARQGHHLADCFRMGNRSCQAATPDSEAVHPEARAAAFAISSRHRKPNRIGSRRYLHRRRWIGHGTPHSLGDILRVGNRRGAVLHSGKHALHEV